MRTLSKPIRRIPLALVPVLLAAPITAQERQPFTAEDALNITGVSVQDMTRDGRYVAALRSTQRDRKNVDHMRFGDPTYISPSTAEVLVIDTDTGDETALFDEKVQTRGFAWSPDGGTLAFFLREGDAYRLYTYDRERGRTREVDLRTSKSIASNSPLEWQPDGRGVLITLRADDWAEASRRAFEELSFGPVIVQDSEDPFLAWDAVRNRSQLAIPALVDITSREVSELFDEEMTIQGYKLSDDGRHLGYLVARPTATSYTRQGGSEFSVHALDLADGSIRTLREPTEDRLSISWNEAGDAFAYSDDGNIYVQGITETEATNVTGSDEEPEDEPEADAGDEEDERLRFSFVRWRPDGGALLASSKEGFHLVDPSAGTNELVLAVPESDSTAPRRRPVGWSPDGNTLFLTQSARDRWERGLVAYDLDSRRMSDLVLDNGLYGAWRFAETGDRVLYTRSDGDLPNELFVADPGFRNPRQLTDLNPWLADRKLTRSELVEYLDVDGRTLYGILYYPVDYQPGQTYPLVAEIYEEFFDNGFNHRMNLLANEGFFGFRPSAHLETGFPGEGWLKGVTAGINSLIERGLVDGDKLGVHGTSYGGYATNILVTQTDRFAAAINISGKVNIISFLGDSPKITVRNYYAAESGQDRIGATLWEQPQKYIAHTAIMNADRIETPLLLMSGEGDWNVPATNQREMYYALRRLGKEVVWVHYMDAGHGAGRSSTVADFHDHWDRILSWYRDHFYPADEEDVTTEDTATGGY
jgi:dipeptidyl aminopeptidase/acylaminoacyl peptidase